MKFVGIPLRIEILEANGSRFSALSFNYFSFRLEDKEPSRTYSGDSYEEGSRTPNQETSAVSF